MSRQTGYVYLFFHLACLGIPCGEASPGGLIATACFFERHYVLGNMSAAEISELSLYSSALWSGLDSVICEVCRD